ncbi:hypothetical protein [Paenibacillus silvae]|uniref:hypothetical protein n=1 Tax=Paenibacillus silvae TaxID=1325358 RepID=UPI0011AA2580|nr:MULTISPECIES: hypothetical protein [Paenibacillus]MCK6076914.1 hypothetical protein [Paenibacillus silvae]MCK6152356.1 hypothetical protein [Paenibacillus silvae]MCK6269579.1 hypothetical protein [Paenibacillus silvae]
MSVVNIPDIAYNKLDIEVTDAIATGNHKKNETWDDVVCRTFLVRNGFTAPQRQKLKWGDFKRTLKVNAHAVVVIAEAKAVKFLKTVQEVTKFEVKQQC